jgi:DNA-binding MarR family transcriptional regulator
MMNKENILIFNFEANKPPVFKEERGKDYIVYGTEAPWKNLYPDYLVELYNTSGKHNSIVNGKTNYISGRGWRVDETVRTLEDKVKLENFINHVGNDSLFELTKKIVKDNELFGGYALEVIVTKDGKGLIINHIDFGDIRVGVEEDTYFYTSDWAAKKPTNNEDFETLTSFPFDGSAVRGERYICYYKSYRPNLKEYPLPNYISGINYIKSDYEVSNYVLNSISNGYSGGTIWNFHNGQPTQEAQAYIKKQIKNKHHGSNNAGEPVIIFDDGKDKGVEIISTNPNGQDDKFINLNQQIQDEIFTAHGVDASVFIKTIDTGFSNNADELRVAIEAMNSSYIEPNQIMYEKLFNDFVVLLGMPSGLRIEKIAPIKVQISESTLVSVLTTDEIRELAGYKPLEKPLEKKTEQVFSNEDRIYIELSNKGYYDDEVELITEKFLDYNPFDFADIGAIDSQIIDILSNEPKTPLSELASTIGETEAEVQQRINRLVKNGLLDVQKTQIKVTDEGEEEVSEIITVYKYVLRPLAPALKTESRDFCKRMVALSRDKSWTYEEINETRFPGGKGSGNNAQGTDVFTNRGGWYTNPNTGTRTPFCRHIWSSRTVRVKKQK